MFGWQLLVLHAITGVCTPVCLSAASISVEAVTPPFPAGSPRAPLEPALSEVEVGAMGCSVKCGRSLATPSATDSPEAGERLCTRVLLSKSYFQLWQ